MDATKLTADQIATLKAEYKFYRNTGSVETGKWVYQPHDFDSSFELYSAGFKTLREAQLDAWTNRQFMGPDGFYLEATPEKSPRDIETIRRENAEAAERARVEEARLAALPDSARTIVLGGDED